MPNIGLLFSVYFLQLLLHFNDFRSSLSKVMMEKKNIYARFNFIGYFKRENS